MKTNTIIVLGCLLFVLALAVIGAEAARGDDEDRRGSGGRGGDYGGGGRSGGGRGGYDDEEEEDQGFGGGGRGGGRGGYDEYENQDYGGGRPNYPARIEPEVTKVVKKCGEDSLKIKFQWDFFIFLKICPVSWSQTGLAQASMAA